MTRTTQTIHIRYPFHDVRAGAGVLSAAVALFSPDDPVELLISPTEGVPPQEQVDELRRLRAELTLPYGAPPRIRMLDGRRAEATPAIVRVTATGDPVADARAILALGSAGRHFSSAYGNTGSHLRGAPDLVRAEVEAAFRARQAHPRRVRDGRVRVVVVLQRVQVWGAVGPIVLAGLERDDVDLDLVLLEDPNGAYQVHDRDAFAQFCEDRGIALRGEDWLRSHLPSIDVAIVPDPYITPAGTSQGLSLRELAAAGIRLVLSPYAQDLSGDVRIRSLLHDLAFHNIAWRIFAPSEGAAEVFAKTCAAGSEHIRYVGNPKREHLLTDKNAAEEGASLRRRLGTRTVTLWNPHFIGDDGRATFHEMAEPIISWFASRPAHGLIVRPHPRLFADFVRSGQGDLVQDFRRLCASWPNIVLDESIDAAPAMLAADALISDLSSLMAEYHALGRPIGMLRPDPDLALNAEDRACLNASTMIDDARGLERFLNRLRPAAPVVVGEQTDLGAGARVLAAVVADFREA